MRVALALLLLSAASPVLAADKYVETAEELMDEAEYARAQRVIDKGLARPGLSDEVLMKLYLAEGVCWVSLGNNARARSSFAKLLTLAPTFDPGTSLAPKIRKQLDKVREQLLASGDLQNLYDVRHRPLGNVSPEGDAVVEVAFGNEERAGDVQRVVVHVRRTGTSEFAALDATRQAGTQTWRARLPAFLLPAESETYAVEYYLEALADGEVRVAGAGSPDLPLSFRVVPKAVLLREEAVDEGAGFPIVPVAVGVGVGVGALVAVAAVIGGVVLLAPRTGSATVTVTQANP